MSSPYLPHHAIIFLIQPADEIGAREKQDRKTQRQNRDFQPFTKRLAGLMSRWTTWCLCASAKPCTWLMIVLWVRDKVKIWCDTVSKNMLSKRFCEAKATKDFGRNVTWGRRLERVMASLAEIDSHWQRPKEGRLPPFQIKTASVQHNCTRVAWGHYILLLAVSHHFS